jgi:hypothetical protein
LALFLRCCCVKVRNVASYFIRNLVNKFQETRLFKRISIFSIKIIFFLGIRAMRWNCLRIPSKLRVFILQMVMSVSEIMVSKDSEQFLTVTKMPQIIMISQREREREILRKTMILNCVCGARIGQTYRNEHEDCPPWLSSIEKKGQALLWLPRSICIYRLEATRTLRAN